MIKKKIASVSVLKPVTDSRALGKIGVSLAQTSKYEINIIGFKAKITPRLPNIFLHPVFDFHRVHPARLLASFTVYRYLHTLKPDIVVVNTHELLAVATLYKLIYAKKMVYDVQENYYRNIRYTKTYPRLLRVPLALMVRSWEKVCARWTDHFILAEQSYARDLRFVRGRCTVVENKTTIQPVQHKERPIVEPVVFLYTGTISVNYGIFDAIRFYDQIKEQVPARLVIAGHCPKKSTLNKLRKALQKRTGVTLIGGADPIAHETIVAQMKAADFALLPYQLDRSIIRCIPTKIYECIALQLPMIIRPNPLWLRLCNQYQACVPSNFTGIDPGFAALLMHKKFYTKGDYNSIRWDGEAAKLIDALDRL